MRKRSGVKCKIGGVTDRNLPWPDIDVPDNHAQALSAWLHAQHGVQVVQAAISARMESEAGCALAEHQALFRLAHAPQHRMSMLRLADALVASPSGATRLVDRLVRRGWVAREQPPDNRRQTDAVLTEDGHHALLHRTRPAYHRALTESFSDLLTAREIADLHRIGRKLLAGHGAYDEHRYAAWQDPRRG
jgi:DNA-binding MarR family transcriptional regulator